MNQRYVSCNSINQRHVLAISQTTSILHIVIAAAAAAAAAYESRPYVTILHVAAVIVDCISETTHNWLFIKDSIYDIRRVVYWGRNQ